MAGTCIRVMVVMLCFSGLICMNGAIPVTRSSNLVQKPISAEVAQSVLLENYDDHKTRASESSKRRIEIELNDYPGSGANNRHTPRAQATLH